MKLPPHIQDLRARYRSKFPVPKQGLGEAIEAFEERARQWTIGLCEQCAFSAPGEGWGCKRADPTRPISKDVLAKADAGRLLGWDLLIGTGTGQPVETADPDSMDLTGQFFEDRPEFFQPTDHVGGSVEPPVEPPVPPTPGPCPECDLTPVLEQGTQIENLIKQLEDNNEARYKDEVNRLNEIKALVKTARTGTVSHRIIGTGTLTINPLP
jgi:hypothetical protein